MRFIFVSLIPLFLVALGSDCSGQQEEVRTPVPTQVTAPPSVPLPPSIHRDFYEKYDRYKEMAIADRRFKHRDIVPLIQKLKTPFRVQEAGRSIEGREIFKVMIGEGPVKVLLWSQMHGDEPTATMAIMDLFNFFSRSDEFDSFRSRILQEMTLIFIPMLNPDGAELFQRRNALGIDLNRDALRLQTPEGQILKRTRDELNADWGFNLHDQPTHIGAGLAPKEASISFLATAYNYEKDINETRGDAMQLISLLNEALQTYIPGKVARYNDDFEPRAFGDNIQKWGTRLILVEAGGLNQDPEKQELRRLHFMILLAAFEAVADRRYDSIPVEQYEQIPMNFRNQFLDLLVREVQVEKNGKWFTVDIGFSRNESSFNGYRDFYYRSAIADLGDLSIFYGYDELNGKGYQAVPGKVYPTVLQPETLKKQDVVQLLKQGYAAVRLTEMPGGRKARTQLPIKLLGPKEKLSSEILPGRDPALLLKKDGRVRYAVVNGFAFDLEKDAGRIKMMMEGL